MPRGVSVVHSSVENTTKSTPPTQRRRCPLPPTPCVWPPGCTTATPSGCLWVGVVYRLVAHGSVGLVSVWRVYSVLVRVSRVYRGSCGERSGSPWSQSSCFFLIDVGSTHKGVSTCTEGPLSKTVEHTPLREGYSSGPPMEGWISSCSTGRRHRKPGNTLWGMPLCTREAPTTPVGKAKTGCNGPAFSLPEMCPPGVYKQQLWGLVSSRQGRGLYGYF